MDRQIVCVTIPSFEIAVARQHDPTLSNRPLAIAPLTTPRALLRDVSPEAAHGQDTLALTDTNGLYGAIRFLDVARQAGLKPILGAELVHQRHRAVLLAKTPAGYANLCRILSARYSDEPFDGIQTVARHRDGLIILSDDVTALTVWRQDSAEDLYVELTPGPTMQEAVTVSRRLGLPPVATTRASFLQPGDYQAHRLLRAIAMNTTLSRLREEDCCATSHWLMPEATVARHYPHLPEALANTRRIAEHCYTDWDFKETIFPAFRQLSTDDAYETLRAKTYDGARWRYGDLTEVVRLRIDTELTVIRDKGYAHYFLIVDEIVRQAPRTCGRGSAAASIVSYCLGITHVDPIRHHLLFERFLNPGRHDPPDIDIDFPWDERPAILDWNYHIGRPLGRANRISYCYYRTYRQLHSPMDNPGLWGIVQVHPG